MDFLAHQDGFVHVGGIARGAQVSANSARTVLRELDQAGRLEVRPTGDMPGPTGAGYRLRPADPARHAPRGVATTQEEGNVGEQLGGLYKTTVVFYTSHPATAIDLAGLIRALRQGDAFSPSDTVRPVLVPLPGGDPDWNDARFAGHTDKIPIVLLCDHCFEKVSGKFAECQPGCLHNGLDDDGPCLWPDGPDRCGWCGQADRLTPVPRDHDGFQSLPIASEHGEGQWRLNWPGSPGDTQGPYPSQEAAWDAWHASAG
jgi:hypothetical protein